MEMNNDIFTPDMAIPEPVDFKDAPIPTPAEEGKPAETPPPRRRRKADAPVLTIESGDEIETADAREAAAWHEIHNAYRTRRILSAPLGGIEQTDSGKTIAVVDYNGFRIVIPLKEMMIAPSAANNADSMAVRQMKLLGNMLGAGIILGIDSKSRSVVASRREALKRCCVQSKYAGRVTDVHKGIVYVRLSNGVNAVAHSCYDRRTPGKKDDVSFVVTKLDEERSIAVGIITRIIRQNL